LKGGWWIDAALEALGSVSSTERHALCQAAACRRIKLAEKARWANQKGSLTKAHDLSHAGRSRIAAAQRARWAKFKAKKAR